MAKRAAIGQIIHAVAARYRVTGSGVLRSRLFSLSQTREQTLPIINMVSRNRKEPTILANFQEQGIQLEFKTTAIDETFNISAMIVFVKPVAEGYPVVTGG